MEKKTKSEFKNELKTKKKMFYQKFQLGRKYCSIYIYMVLNMILFSIIFFIVLKLKTKYMPYSWIKTTMRTWTIGKSIAYVPWSQLHYNPIIKHYLSITILYIAHSFWFSIVCIVYMSTLQSTCFAVKALFNMYVGTFSNCHNLFQ